MHLMSLDSATWIHYVVCCDRGVERQGGKHHLQCVAADLRNRLAVVSAALELSTTPLPEDREAVLDAQKAIAEALETS